MNNISLPEKIMQIIHDWTPVFISITFIIVAFLIIHKLFGTIKKDKIEQYKDEDD